MNNYEILDCPSGKSIEDVRQFLETKSIPEDLASLHEQPSQFNFECAVRLLVKLLELHHLGAPSSRPPIETAKEASKLVRDYFGTDWYLSDPDDEEALRKEPENDELTWFGMLTMGLLVAALANDRKTLQVLGDWVECWLVPEYADPPTDPLLGKTFVSISAAFRSESLEGLDEMEGAIGESRKQQPKLLFQTWRAARNRDQEGFNGALLKSVQHFEKTMREPTIPRDAIAFYPSILLAVARHYGLSLPEYEPRIMARLVCHESLGLPLPKKFLR